MRARDSFAVGMVVMIFAFLALVSSAGAVEKCNVKRVKKTGLMRVTGAGGAGTLMWGNEAGQEPI